MSDDIKEKATLAWNRKRSYLNLQEKFNDNLTFAHSGGMWCANRELIAFLNAFSDIDQITVCDIYNVPKQVSPAELLCLCKEKYQFAANAWAIEYAKLSRVRKSENV